MNTFKSYVAYLKDNPQKFWFKRKLYGWGWVPVRWQGWLVVALFLVFVFWNVTTLETDTASFSADFYWYFGRLAIGIVILLAICWKTGETPRWQWGPEKKT